MFDACFMVHGSWLIAHGRGALALSQGPGPRVTPAGPSPGPPLPWAPGLRAQEPHQLRFIDVSVPVRIKDLEKLSVKISESCLEIPTSERYERKKSPPSNFERTWMTFLFPCIATDRKC